ncbi:MAG: sulfatase-like hydrolase/transferase, partial [Planctomycetota bacterium]
MFATAVDASTRFVCLLILCIASATACTGAESKPAVAQKPNIIFILCDDLGFGDIAALRTGKPYGKSFTTPGMDAMAAGGTRMTRHYCPAPVCAPSRASLLLGVHQGNCEIRDNQFDKQLPDNHTLGSVLQTAGYATVMVGKYGLQGDKRYAMKENGTKPSEWPGYPTKRGFGEFFGMVRHVDGHLHYPAHGWDLGNSDSHREPKQVWHNEKEISSELNRCYTTDLFTDPVLCKSGKK